LINPASPACNRRVHIGGTTTAVPLTARPSAETSSGAPVALSSRTAAGRVVSPVRNCGLVKMSPREPNQNRLSRASRNDPRQNERADHRALVIGPHSSAECAGRASLLPAARSCRDEQLGTSGRAGSEVASAQLGWTAMRAATSAAKRYLAKRTHSQGETMTAM